MLVNAICLWTLHISAGSVENGVDRVECVLSLATVGRGCLTWVPGRSSIRVTQPRSTYPSSFRGQSSRDLTLSAGVRFSTWGLWRLFLGECRRCLWDFLSCRARLGYGPAPGTILKRPHAALVWLLGRMANIVG